MEPHAVSTDVDPEIEALERKAFAEKFLTYDELIAGLPDSWVDPEKVDELLVRFQQRHIELAFSTRRRAEQKVKFEEDRKPAAASAAPAAHQPDLIDGETPEEVEKALAQAIDEAQTRRIDDPVRMYLTQMGEISLLTRDREIYLAKKIETCRMVFRRLVLQNDYAVQQAVETLELVHSGDLPFDRTMKIATNEENAKEKISTRIPGNLKTIKQLLEQNREDWNALYHSGRTTKAARQQIADRIARRRRKMATLIEELSLRTSKIQPLMKKLRSICLKMKELQRDLARAAEHPERFEPEDVMVMREELNGLRSLVMEEPDDLGHHVEKIGVAFFEYEQAKRDLSGGNLRLVVSIAKKYRTSSRRATPG
jgi:RNA polymerase primary sigma factor